LLVQLGRDAYKNTRLELTGPPMLHELDHGGALAVLFDNRKARNRQCRTSLGLEPVLLVVLCLFFAVVPERSRFFCTVLLKHVLFPSRVGQYPLASFTCVGIIVTPQTLLLAYGHVVTFTVES
jgi:hypothetical protein